MPTTVVIGANRGIGLELVRQLNARGDDVIATCRSASPELRELGIRVEEGIDVSRDDVVQTLRDRLAGVEASMLIHNAGILERLGLDELDWDSFRRQFEVNSLGPLRTVVALRTNLIHGARVGLITSRVGSVGDNQSGGSYPYRTSKAALNMIGKNLAHDLARDGVSVVLLHPGFVRTAMTRGNGTIDAAEAAAGLIARMDELTPERTGTFVHANGEELPW